MVWLAVRRLVGTRARAKRLAAATFVLAAAGAATQAQTPAAPAAAQPQTAAPPAATPQPPVVSLPEVDVTASPELLSAPLDRNKVASAVNTVTSQEVVRTGIPNMLGALEENVAGVSQPNAGGNPYQPDISYHGFSASPLEGSDQGLAVYVNGARFNQPFGDTVNWDLIPAIAIDRMDLEGSNPVFGLNALGGSLSVKLKNGFTFHGGDVSVYGGSFGRVGTSFEWGREKDGTSTYIAATLLDDNGWRQQSSTRLSQIYADLGWRGTAGEAHLSIIGADNTLNQPGTVPVELLAANRGGVFTGPNKWSNKYLAVTGNVAYDVSDHTTLQALLYYQNLSQRIYNGNTPDFQACASGNGFLCEDDGVTPLTGRNGLQIPDFLNNTAGITLFNQYSQFNTEAVDTNGYGGSLQATDDREIFGRSNNLVVGVSFDGGVTTFDGNTLAGGFDPTNGNFIGPGVAIDQADLSIAPARVYTTTAYYGVYVNDIYDLTRRLSLTLSGRFNAEQIDLNDPQSSLVTGNHYYDRFNPGIGLTYKLRPNISFYVSYSEANRAPTAAELSCASIASPCTLANFFVGDPNLKQVVARTVEAGLRGVITPFAGVKLNWDLDIYRTETQDDLIFAPSTLPGLDFFQNVGRTQRQGIDLTGNLLVGRVSLLLGYSLTDATFQSPLTLDSSLNPGADANGQIFVQPGDRLPGIPLQQLKLGFDMQVTSRWVVGLRAIAASGQYLFGDEANLTPTTGAYFVLNANTSYQLFHNIQLFASVENVLNAKYANYGTFSPTTSALGTLVPTATNTRSLSPGAPIAAYGGVKMTF